MRGENFCKRGFIVKRTFFNLRAVGKTACRELISSYRCHTFCFKKRVTVIRAIGNPVTKSDTFV